MRNQYEDFDIILFEHGNNGNDTLVMDLFIANNANCIDSEIEIISDFKNQWKCVLNKNDTTFDKIEVGIVSTSFLMINNDVHIAIHSNCFHHCRHNNGDGENKNTKNTKNNTKRNKNNHETNKEKDGSLSNTFEKDLLLR